MTAASGRVRDDSLLPSLADKSVEDPPGIQGPSCLAMMRMASGAGPVSRQAGWLEKQSQPELEAEVAQIVAETREAAAGGRRAAL